MSAGFWKEVANALDSEPRESGDPDSIRRSEPVPPEVPDGGMLVPIDAWTRVLDQLGHLHQAGQDLAEARERAAKAETEVIFLRDQLGRERSKRSAPEQPRTSSNESAAPETKTIGARVLKSARSGLATARDRWQDSRYA